jgi:hypothetical protein
MSQTTQPASRLIHILGQDLSYCDPSLKQAFHQEGRKVLRRIARLMGLQKGQYEVRSNLAGIAVSGEVTLHTDQVYVQIAQPSMGESFAILLRSCKGRMDYTGGMNHFAPIAALQNLEQFAHYVECVAHNQACGMVWNPKQIRCDVAHFRANRVINPELERVRERFEAGELTIEVFEQAITMAERNRAAA